MTAYEDQPETQHTPSRKAEWLSFLFVTLVLLPGLTVFFVGGYGFVVWTMQMINGPPAG